MVSADVIIVDVIVLHGGVAHRAVGPVVVNACGRVLVRGAAVQAEPLHPVPSPGKAAGQGIVGVQDQLRLRMEGRENGVIHPLRMAVPGQLVPVEIGDNKLRGMEILEAVGSVPLVAFQQQHIGLDPAAQRSVGQNQGGNTLHLIGALGIIDDVPALRSQHRGDHLYSGGLAVGAGDSDDVGRQRHPFQNIRAYLQGKLAGHGTALADELSHKAAQLADHNG